MTPEQQDQWNRYGCACRCLLKLSELCGKPISADDFVARHIHKYPQWQSQCGATVTSMVIDLARDLQLCTQAHVFTDMLQVKQLIGTNKLKGCLIFTDSTGNKTTELDSHCWLLSHAVKGKDEYTLWNPLPDGQMMARQTNLDKLNQHVWYYLCLM